jgi:hypothetical protein
MQEYNTYKKKELIMKKQLAIYLLAIGSSFTVLTACDNAVGKKEDAIARQQETKRVNDSLKLDSFKRAESSRIALEEREKAEKEDARVYQSKEANVMPRTNTQNVIQPVASAPQQQQQKKGWSDAAKGTAIGAGVGAGVGALIDKDKRGRGAIIGGVIGGSGGYAIGRKSDRESGRVEKK